MKQIKYNAFNNYKQTAIIWDDVKKVKDVLVVVHSLHENVKQFENLAKFLNKHGIVVCGFELRLHGKHISENTPLCETNDFFKDNVNDLYTFIKLMENTYNTKVTVLGNGFSAHIVKRLLQISNICKKAILSSYTLGTNVSLKIVNPMVFFFNLINNKTHNEFIKNIIFSEFKFTKQSDRKTFSNSETFTTEFLQSDQYKLNLPINYYKSFISNIKVNDKNTKNIDKNSQLLVLSGELFELQNKSTVLHKLSNELQKYEISHTMQTIKNALYDLYNDNYSNQTFNEILNFINQK